jgi:hypothetical protein
MVQLNVSDLSWIRSLLDNKHCIQISQLNKAGWKNFLAIKQVFA